MRPLISLALVQGWRLVLVTRRRAATNRPQASRPGPSEGEEKLGHAGTGSHGTRNQGSVRPRRAALPDLKEKPSASQRCLANSQIAASELSVGAAGRPSEEARNSPRPSLKGVSNTRARGPGTGPNPPSSKGRPKRKSRYT